MKEQSPTRACSWLTVAVLALLTAKTIHAEPSAGAQAIEESNEHLWQPRTKSVAVFKNGMGFFLRQGPAKLREGWAVAKEIPPAKFGTLAIVAAREDELVDMIGAGPGEVVEFDGIDAAKDNETRRKRLAAALKLKVQLSYTHQGTARTAMGKLVSIGADFAVVDDGENSFAVPLEGIVKMQLLEMPLRIHVTNDDDQPVQQTEIGMAYLREGITWIPEYSLRILDDDTAELTLRGTLVNEAEDLIHCDVNFVVGVPHFMHTQYLAPIAVGQAIRTLGAAVAPREVQQQIMNRAALSGNSVMVNQFDAGRPGAEGAITESGDKLAQTLGNLPQLDAAAGSDYTVYTKQDLTVRRGERAIVTLFVKKIRYSHIYRWSPPEIMQHFLVLHNDSDTAWTTGPCLAVSQGQPLSEDLLKYTPRAGRCELPVTASVNIAHERSEREIDRDAKAIEPSRNEYLDLVRLEGELKLRNFERRDVEVIVVAPVSGKPTSATEGGELAADSTRLQLRERAGTVRWSIKLKPAETKLLKYTYERYVPSN